MTNGSLRMGRVGGSPGGWEGLFCICRGNELLVTVTIRLSQRWKVPFTKGESKHYLEQILYHTLIFTKETEGERPEKKNRFPRGRNCNENK